CLSVCAIIRQARPLSRPRETMLVMAGRLLCRVREICFIIPQAAEKGDGFQTISAADVRRQRSASRRKKFPAAAIFFSLKVVIVCRAAKMAGKTFCNLMQERRMSWTQIFSQFEK
ncbi:MAG: hypothetical protein UGE23_11195, partial [Peptococcaceae bacterium]|nr:hypothetical protein [Peptococcaceae bacterium]